METWVDIVTHLLKVCWKIIKGRNYDILRTGLESEYAQFKMNRATASMLLLSSLPLVSNFDDWYTASLKKLVFSRFHSSTGSPVLTCHGCFFLNLRFYQGNREGSRELILDWSTAYAPCWYDAEMLCVKIYEGYLCFNNSSNHLGT